ncbi:MAG: type III polyketide synthase [Acidobacteria bacterium]|nr:type III polyketide synthase [Acidobacteriota bacterium]
MPKIASIGTAVPPHCFPQERIRDLAKLHFSNGIHEIDRLIAVFDNVRVKRRFFSVPLEWFGQDHSFREKNAEYIRSATELSLAAIERCLAGAHHRNVDQLVFVSSSGMATPSLDAHLINRLKLGANIRRTPIFGYGCAGGAAGLARCFDLAKAYPAHRILLVSVELSSLTFQRNDFSKSNLVASALFADGAAAVLVCGDDCSEEGIEIVDVRSTLWPETLDVMGWEFSERGLEVVFSRSIPQLISRHIRKNIEEFLAGQKQSLTAIKHFIIHPGGAKVLDSFKEALQVTTADLRYSRHVLESFGNMSAPTVIFILDLLQHEARTAPGELGLCAAFGPGFSSELLLLRWN